MARPRKRQRLTQTTFRLSEEELLSIQAAAESWGVSPSHFIRAAGTAIASSTPEEQAQVLRSVNQQSGGAAIPLANDDS